MTTAPGKWKVAAYLTAIFAAGMVSGWVVAGREAKWNRPPPHPPGPPGSGPGRSFTTSSIYQLPLRPEQKSKVDAILAEYTKKMEARRDIAMTEFRRDSSNRNAELSAVLTPEQQAQWEKIRKERDASRGGTNSWRGGSNSSHGPPPGDKGERGPRNRGNRERRGQENANAEGGRSVTNPPGAQSTTPSAPPR